MKTLPGNGKINGLTLIELLVVIAVIAVLAAILLPALSGGPRKSKTIYCLSNQKQIAIGLIMFKGDYNERLPWQVSTAEGGSIEFVESNSVVPHFQLFSNYLNKQTQILICPTDKDHQAAINFTSLTRTNVSYFLNFEVTNSANSILSGDRLLEFNGAPIHSGVFMQTTNIMISWASDLHNPTQTRRGNFSFGDGHAQSVTPNNLNNVLRNQPFATNRFCFP